MIKKLTRSTVVIGLLLFVSIAAGRAWYRPAELAPPPQRPQNPPAAAVDQAAPTANEAAHHLHLPVIQRPPSWIDTTSREASRALFLADYRATETDDIGWTGDHDSCNAGETSAVFRAAMLRRVNYFRSMAGVPNIRRFDDEYNRKAQDAALMMSVNDQLSHTPPADWRCFTTTGEEGAGRSNLALGYDGTGAISDGYMRDWGDQNYHVGHRRWILYPQTQLMGTGDIPWRDNYRSSNALWVLDLEHLGDPRPDTRAEFVAWPPPGYVPYDVVYPRWSFAYPDANFDQATVSMKRGAQNIPLQLNTPAYGFGENTLVWEPQANLIVPPTADTAYQVSVNNVIIDGQARDFTYTVIIFDPDQE